MKKVLVLSTYPIYPRKHGGQLRVFHLYNQLGTVYDVTIVSFNYNDPCSFYKRKIGNLTELSILMTKEHMDAVWNIEKECNVSLADILMPKYSCLTPHYYQIAAKFMEQSDIIVAAQPYLFHLIEEYASSKTIIYDSQNVEYLLKKSMLPNHTLSQTLLHDLFHLEMKACKLSNFVLTPSENDAQNMIQLYSLNPNHVFLIPNGVDSINNPYNNLISRYKKKKELGLQNDFIVVFIGSCHPPNIEAVEEILKMAIQLPQIQFFIMGGLHEFFLNKSYPANVVFFGLVDDHLKQLIYSIADIALNPMMKGSGTNLKIAEYMSYEIPVISTRIGARGYGFTPNTQLIVSELEDFPTNMIKLRANKKMRLELARNGRKYIAKNYSWDKISKKLYETLENPVNDKNEHWGSGNENDSNPTTYPPKRKSGIYNRIISGFTQS